MRLPVQGRREEYSAGAAVRGPAGWLVIRDRWGRWSLPKGKIDPGETPREAARREVREETGVSARIVSRIGQTSYTFWRRGRLRRKRVIYYLAETDSQQLRPNVGEVQEAKWVGVPEFLQHCDYENNEEIFRLALTEVGEDPCRGPDVDGAPNTG